ncbi:MAG: BON domain-containing protein [Cyanobacteria bacterium P01_A01_bin.17]
MKQLVIALLGATLGLATAACVGQQPHADVPESGEIPSTLNADLQEDTSEDATSGSRDRRLEQLGADIRAWERRNEALDNGAGGHTSDLASEVLRELQTHLPNSVLTVEAEEGLVIVAGLVSTQEQYVEIERLAKGIKGVQLIVVNAAVTSAQL